MSEKMEYVYLGDRFTDPALRSKMCKAVRRSDGKCRRGKNGNFLIVFEDGKQAIVIGRLLRKVKNDTILQAIIE